MESQCSARVVDLYNFYEPIYNVEGLFLSSVKGVFQLNLSAVLIPSIA